MNGKGRIVELDLAKVFAFVWIVFLWHMTNYLTPDYSFKEIISNDYSKCVTRSMLSLFVFLSGVFLSKYTFSDKKDVLAFYKKRFLRFYILYAIACVTIFFCGNYIPSLQQLIYTLFGLSGIISPSVGTLWFMSMMMFFYLLTPLVFAADNKLKLLRCAIVMALIVVIHHFGVFDERYLLYFPCYAIGLCFGNDILRLINPSRIYCYILPVLWVLSIIMKWDHVSVGFGIGTIVLLSSIIVRLLKSRVAVSAIIILSDLILCGYLFHRQIIYVFHTQMHIALYYTPLFILVLSYLIQKSYDILLLRVQGIRRN